MTEPIEGDRSVPAMSSAGSGDPHLSNIGKIRRRCVHWLDGECRGGPECRCLPPAPNESTTETS